ncbi:hypothetical protein BU24DRAFT_419861 [Aaosphaeria arxii CBS 175.79]|uniref:Zn(2)-C6 fungal-type domain-containing protein n=1 Tax=Aaosphaeria arxii CBS 175.79 TaxID=1450172 RepID=A0A6A5Y4X9_9PLEO|nr:uncharacterized protein BU24DRAFT_419861 [Aaosphaeria arxii CBS 175.79]KAF2020316.1 hypothetical protein BU24DRAFT_419861 [Aaosphaeria arxii CBS 175.79]
MPNYESSNPCGGCRTRSLRCVIDRHSGFCTECLASTRKCDKVVTAEDFDRAGRMLADLRRQVDEADAAVLRAKESAHEALGREIRLRKQLQLAEKRYADLAERERLSIEELEQMQATESSPSGPSTAPSGSSGDAVPFDFDALSPSWVANFDFGTGPTTVGSSSSS